MASRYTLAWLKDQTQNILNANPLQVDADFTDSQLTWAINEAASDELNQAKMETNPLFFLRPYRFTWPSNQEQYVLTGTPLEYAEVFRFYIIQSRNTDKERRVKIDFEYRDSKTLFWRYYQGPSGDSLIEALYWPAANFLVEDTQEPDWIAPSYRNLLAWSAAILLREIADESAPGNWYRRRDALRYNWWNSVNSRPEHDVARVQNHDETFNLEGEDLNYYFFEG